MSTSSFVIRPLSFVLCHSSFVIRPLSGFEDYLQNLIQYRFLLSDYLVRDASVYRAKALTTNNYQNCMLKRERIVHLYPKTVTSATPDSIL
ncbi:hypothetical protein [Coleofasciculus sp. F4-SAH-05]|uniref:hypothetical protein n=1 Tax=Coleofasciculus sp. F4-SAH-05 TaxID=3069525 RepID=UPI0032F7E6E6